MATDITIPTITLPVGQSTFGPHAMSQEHTCSLTLDRTVAGGLNSLTSATGLDVEVNSSIGGVTFRNEAGFTTVGGIISGVHGQINANTLIIEGMGGRGAQVEIVTTVTGPSTVVVDGSIVLS